MDYTVKTAVGLENNPDARLIRKAVFMDEQGFCNEFDGIDAEAVHTVLYVDGKPAATGRLYEENGGFHIGRVAVNKEYRGQSLGSAVVTILEKEAWKRSADSVSLSAQVRAKPFYEKLGYKSLEDLHMDEYCPHVTMVKTK